MSPSAVGTILDEGSSVDDVGGSSSSPPAKRSVDPVKDGLLHVNPVGHSRGSEERFEALPDLFQEVVEGYVATSLRQALRNRRQTAMHLNHRGPAGGVKLHARLTNRSASLHQCVARGPHEGQLAARLADPDRGVRHCCPRNCACDDHVQQETVGVDVGTRPLLLLHVRMQLHGHPPQSAAEGPAPASYQTAKTEIK
eukprot:CAMPEP_0203915836 /NCGR_PEP_ID=MMETSP0359-20131031/56576_1 /ASSEMBLY_ACC=CAM_ASM_000338 /TAXON_ID=268821 /ORGANISM="Scrippsiella Hangoei, Strain SHTV-5" /LENGTH=196 /DNA_ID=CAMNT_0050842413 /DNA_START=80 /DNA_END=669 /DNA_ORIENTATION=+